MSGLTYETVARFAQQGGTIYFGLIFFAGLIYALRPKHKEAFKRLVAGEKFKSWHKIECARRLGQRIPETKDQIRARVDKMVDDGLRTGDVLVEEIEVK